MRELTLEETLREVSRQRVILLANGKPWGGASSASRTLQHACRVHRDELVQLVEGSDWRVCADPGLHWRYWNVETDQCEACAHLQVAMRRLDELSSRQRRSRSRVLASAG